jgi:hypothetical protein
MSQLPFVDDENHINRWMSIRRTVEQEPSDDGKMPSVIVRFVSAPQKVLAEHGLWDESGKEGVREVRDINSVMASLAAAADPNVLVLTSPVMRPSSGRISADIISRIRVVDLKVGADQKPHSVVSDVPDGYAIEGTVLADDKAVVISAFDARSAGVIATRHVSAVNRGHKVEWDEAIVLLGQAKVSPSVELKPGVGVVVPFRYHVCQTVSNVRAIISEPIRERVYGRVDIRNPVVAVITGN